MAETIGQALGVLSKAAIEIERLEGTRDMAIQTLDRVLEQLHEAQEAFNEARAEALQFVPALETGYPIPQETVSVVDGRIVVTKEE